MDTRSRGGRRVKVYLAGPMRGHPQLNFPTFHAEAARLRAQGHEVFNPAEQHAVSDGPPLRDVLRADLSWICQHAEQVALLPGWQSSKGACAERAVAQALGLEVVYL